MAQSPIRPTDAEALDLTRSLLEQARTAALAVIHPEHGGPHVTRIAIALHDATPVTLISDLSLHTTALAQNPRCALLLGEPGDKGDPLTHPRITLTANARRIARDDAAFDNLRDAYLAQNPKAKLYVDFADFSFAAFDIASASLNGGFGKAFELGAEDVRRALAP